MSNNYDKLTTIGFGNKQTTYINLSA